MSMLADQPEPSRPEPLRITIRAIAPLVIIVLMSLAFQLVGKVIGDYPTRIVLDVGIAVILAVSLNIVNGFTGQFSIGHAAFATIGGYAAAAVTYYGSLLIWGDSVLRPVPHSLMLIGAAIIGGLVAVGTGWIVGLPSLRLRGDYLAIVTLGFGEIVRVLLQQTNQQLFTIEELREAGASHLFPPPVGGATGFTSIPPAYNLCLMGLAVGITVLFAYRLKQSSYGRALLSIREDEIASEAMGVNVTRLKVRAFMFAAFFAGVGGALQAHEQGTTLRPVDAGFLRSFEIVIMVVLGGLGSISGSVLAAILVTVLQAMLAEYGQYRMIIYALTLILLMIFRPKGLFGTREIWDYWPLARRRAA